MKNKRAALTHFFNTFVFLKAALTCSVLHDPQASKGKTFAFNLKPSTNNIGGREKMYFLRFSFGGVISLPADDDTLVSLTGKGSFSNGSPNLIVGNVPSGSQRASLPHLSSLG